MTNNLTIGIVRLLDPRGQTAGTGFVLTNDGLIATCAHVAEAAGGRPGETVRLICHATGDETSATVEPQGWRDPTAEDIAILRLTGSLPPSVEPLLLKLAELSAGHRFRAFGFPAMGTMAGI